LEAVFQVPDKLNVMEVTFEAGRL